MRFRTAMMALSLAIPVFSACQNSFHSCEDSLSCPPEGDGDGDGDTGGTGGDGDGDGDGDTGGANSACDPECEGDTPVCDEENETCVECLEMEDCTDGLCDTESNSCVDCLGNADCTEAAASLCDAGTCSSCSADVDCSHVSDTPTCDVDAGTCVECLPAEDDRESDTDACGTGVCNSQTFSCDDSLTQGTKDICKACIADSECLVGQNCIPLQYTGGAEPVELGGFCMKIFPGCSPPFQAGALNRVSLSGAPATDYCGLAEEFTTCAAIEDLKDGKLCSNGSQCGSGNGENLCETINGGDETQCTYACTSSNQCVSGNNCDGVVGDEYCGGPDL